MLTSIGLLAGLGVSSLAAPAGRPPEPPPPPPAIDASAGPAVRDRTTRELSLSAALQTAWKNNPDLHIALEAENISEGRVLEAMGAFDLAVLGRLGIDFAETPQRGSQYTFALAQRRVAGLVGIERRFAIGGVVRLEAEISQVLTTQPVDIADAGRGSVQLATYRIAPRLVLTQPLLRGAGFKVNRAPVHRAKLEVGRAMAEAQAASQTIVASVITGYFELSYAHRNVEDKRSGLQLAEAHFEQTRRLVASGRRTSVDEKAAQLDVMRRRIDLARAEQAYLAQSLEMSRLMGDELTAADARGWVPSTDPALEIQPVNVADQVDRALRSNPTVRELELAVAGNQIDRELAANLRLPQLDVTAEFAPIGRSTDSIPPPISGRSPVLGSWGQAFRNIANDNVARDGVLAEWSITAGVELRWAPLNRTGRGAEQAARGRLRQAELRLEALRRRLIMEVLTAGQAVRTAQDVLDLAGAAVELAEANLKGEQLKYGLGRATSFEVSLRLDDLQQARSEALRARIDLLKARTELQRLTGELLDDYGFSRDD